MIVNAKDGFPCSDPVILISVTPIDQEGRGGTNSCQTIEELLNI